MASQRPTAHHVGITVGDLERTVAFYRDVLGLDVVARFEVAGESYATAVGVEEASARFVHLDAEGVRIELVTYEPAGADRGAARLNQPGAAHVGLSVEDVDALLAGLPDDVDPVSEPRTTATGTRLAFVHDPEGNLVELLEA